MPVGDKIPIPDNSKAGMLMRAVEEAWGIESREPLFMTVVHETVIPREMFDFDPRSFDPGLLQVKR